LNFLKYIFDSTFILLLALPRNNNVDSISLGIHEVFY